jgi:hypothetical protein
MKRRIFGAAALCLLLAMSSHAQPQTQPQTYSFTASSLASGPSTLTVNRNGSKERIEVHTASGGVSLRVLYDFQAHRIYTTDLTNKTCTTQEYSSAYAPQLWDPIGGAAEYAAQIGSLPKVRKEAVNGMPAALVEAQVSQGKARYWLEEKYGFPVKLSYALGKEPERVMLELRELSYAPSAASLFAAPAGCTQIGGVSTANGGHAEMAVSASVAGAATLGGADEKPAAQAGDPKALMGKWDFTGKSAAGVEWHGTLTVEKLDADSFDSSKYSNVCEFDLASEDSGRGVSGPCLYDPATKKFSMTGGRMSNAYSFTATLAPDGKSLTQGSWVEGARAPGTWTAKR